MRNMFSQTSTRVFFVKVTQKIRYKFDNKSERSIYKNRFSSGDDLFKSKNLGLVDDILHTLTHYEVQKKTQPPNTNCIH